MISRLVCRLGALSKATDSALFSQAASVCSLSSALGEAGSSCLQRPAEQRPYSSSADAHTTADSKPTKLHILKCTTAAPTPHSQAIAFMLSKDQIPREQLVAKMDILSRQLLDNISTYSSTEISAFTEACRQIGYVHLQAFAAALQQLAPSAASIQADELPSLLWAGARLAHANTPSSSSSSSSSSNTSSSSSSSSGGSSDGGGDDSKRTTPVPRNDGVCGSVSSSRIAGLPGVVEFVLGAAQVLTSDVEDVASEELPVLAAALADMEYRDPFLLTALAEASIERRAELSESELLALLSSFAAMGRWFYDNRVLDSLTAEVLARAQQGTVGQPAVDAVAAALDSINHNNKALKQYLQERDSSKAGA